MTGMQVNSLVFIELSTTKGKWYENTICMPMIPIKSQGMTSY